jgi:hypothetical protein
MLVSQGATRMIEQRSSDSEVLEVGHGRLDDAAPLPDLGPLDLPPIDRPPSDPADAARRRRPWVALLLIFALGIAVGAVSWDARTRATMEPTTALIAGQVTLSSTPERVGELSGTVSLVVPVHATGADVEVLAIALSPEWPVDRPQPVTVPAGGWLNITANVGLDCQQPEPATPTAVEAHIRTRGDERDLTMPLSRPARALTEAWRTFCPSAEHFAVEVTSGWVTSSRTGAVETRILVRPVLDQPNGFGVGRLEVGGLDFSLAAIDADPATGLDVAVDTQLPVSSDRLGPATPLDLTWQVEDCTLASEFGRVALVTSVVDGDPSAPSATYTSKAELPAQFVAALARFASTECP